MLESNVNQFHIKHILNILSLTWFHLEILEFFLICKRHLFKVYYYANSI